MFHSIKVAASGLTNTKHETVDPVFEQKKRDYVEFSAKIKKLKSHFIENKEALRKSLFGEISLFQQFSVCEDAGRESVGEWDGNRQTITESQYGLKSKSIIQEYLKVTTSDNFTENTVAAFDEADIGFTQATQLLNVNFIKKFEELDKRIQNREQIVKDLNYYKAKVANFKEKFAKAAAKGKQVSEKDNERIQKNQNKMAETEALYRTENTNLIKSFRKLHQNRAELLSQVLWAFLLAKRFYQSEITNKLAECVEFAFSKGSRQAPKESKTPMNISTPPSGDSALLAASLSKHNPQVARKPPPSRPPKNKVKGNAKGSKSPATPPVRPPKFQKKVVTKAAKPSPLLARQPNSPQLIPSSPPKQTVPPKSRPKKSTPSIPPKLPNTSSIPPQRPPKLPSNKLKPSKHSPTLPSALPTRPPPPSLLAKPNSSSKKPTPPKRSLKPSKPNTSKPPKPLKTPDLPHEASNMLNQYIQTMHVNEKPKTGHVSRKNAKKKTTKPVEIVVPDGPKLVHNARPARKRGKKKRKQFLNFNLDNANLITHQSFEDYRRLHYIGFNECTSF